MERRRRWTSAKKKKIEKIKKERAPPPLQRGCTNILSKLPKKQRDLSTSERENAWEDGDGSGAGK